MLGTWEEMTLIHAYAVYFFSNLEAGRRLNQKTGQSVVKVYRKCLVLLSRRDLAVLSCLNSPVSVESITIELLFILRIKFKDVGPIYLKFCVLLGQSV
jgi:hypothetical protein